MGTEFMYVDGETDGLTERHGGTKGRVFCNFVNAPKNWLSLNVFVLAIQNELEYADYSHLSRDAV